MKPVLLIIDMQKDFFAKAFLLEQKNGLVENINWLVDFFRKNHLPIIWVRQVMKADLSDSPRRVRESGKEIVLEGTPGTELVDGLVKELGDFEIIKKRYSGFYNTGLDEILKKLEIDTVVITGISTHACIRMTAIDAYQRDYQVIIAKDCVGSWDYEHHLVTLRYFEPTIAEVLTNQQLSEKLAK